MEEDELETLLALDGSGFEMGSGLIVEFSVRRAVVTPERPHGISYALVLRRKDGGRPWVRFDNAHSVDRLGRGYRRTRAAYDHWHRTETDAGRPYDFTTAAQLLDDVRKEVRRTLNERGIQNDL